MKITRVTCYFALLLMAVAASQRLRASQLSKEHIARTKVVLLGTGTPVPDPDRSGPETAIVVDDSAILSISDPVLCVALRPPFSTGTSPHLSPPT